MPSDLPPSDRPALTLPYAFDTTRTGRVIFKGMLSLQAILLVGVVYKIWAFSPADVAGGVLALILVTCFGVFIFKKLGGSTGVVTQSQVQVRPDVQHGVRADGAEGVFALCRFKAVRVESIGPCADVDVATGQHERVILAGNDGTPDVLIAQTSDFEGLRLGREFGDLLGLPVEQKQRPY